MTYDQRLEKVSVLGAAGKMGSGILLLTALEMADLSLKPENKGKTFVLNAIDLSDENLAGLMDYLEVQIRKAAEKKAVMLRKVYEHRADLIENFQIIEQYVRDTVKIVRTTNRIEAAYNSNVIFEAVSENKELKTKILSQINQNNSGKPFFLTNTSSIPIQEIDEISGLEGRIIGYHFYNPPAIQKLLELIQTPDTQKELIDFSIQFAKNLRKIVVPSNDKAGFIGNGHFMRDALHGINETMRLSEDLPFVEALYMLNRVSQDYLVRPMGIFQLIDYVGIDVVQFILNVMKPYYPGENLHSPLLDQFMEMGVKGGQNPDGSQKPGFFTYEKGRPVSVFDPGSKSYIPIGPFQSSADERLGTLPSSFIPWKNAVKLKNKEEALARFFNDIKSEKSLGANLAIRYALKSLEIGNALVSNNVALNHDDVNTVLCTGFFHAYGPVNTFFN